MFRRYSTNFALLSMGLDGLIATLALALAVILRPSLSALPFAEDLPNRVQLPWLLYPGFASIWVGILLLLSAYDGRKNLFAVDEFTTLTVGFLLATVSMAGTLYLSFREISRLLFLTFVLIAFLGMIVWRTAARLAFRRLNGHAAQKRSVLIVGSGPVGRELLEKIKQHPYQGLTVAGFLDDDTRKRELSADILGPLDSARQVIIAKNIHDVVVALPRRAYERVNRLVAELHDLPVKVWVIPDYFNLALHKAVVEEFAGLPMLDLRAPALNDYQRMLKRAFDLGVIILFMPLTLPLMGLIALAIRLESQGPVLFRQQRVGENGELFEMFKFRTMVENAEEMRHIVEYIDEHGNLIHKTPNDPRVTRIGRFLRRTSLDELPQIINILRGEMSLVGPRPELPYLVQRYQPWQRKRFAVPQGVTGWWQVNGRSDKPMHLHTEDDLYYVQHYSLLLDLKILLKTFLVVLRGKGAY